MTLRAISNARRDALLVEIHRAIEVAAKDTAGELTRGEWTPIYPPDGWLSEEEHAALNRLRDPELLRVLAKAIADASSRAFFRAFAVIDAVGDPDRWAGDTWMPIRLAELDYHEDEEGNAVDDVDDYAEMLHDLFFDTYASFEKSR
jgi:hypothetical protein